jgi:integrase
MARGQGAHQYPGVRARGNSIQIDFSYQGQRFRETLRLEPNATHFREANRKLQAVKYDIAMGNFDYGKHFPCSKQAISFSKIPGKHLSVEAYLKRWILKKRPRCQPSTMRDYESAIYVHLMPTFGQLSLADLTSQEVESWVQALSCSNKRVNNILVPLRQAFKDAYHDGLILNNPLDRVRQMPVLRREPNPMSNKEIDAVLQQMDGQERNFYQFAFWTGLRTSEQLALKWENIDLANSRFYVRVAKVRGQEKTTKTSAGLRTVELQEDAKAALLNQLEYTDGKEYVFHDPKTDMQWKSDQPLRKRVWIPALKRAAVDYRNPYQTRHTFASMMLSRGKNPLWVASQMGHSDWGEIRKTYGRWLSGAS